MHKLSLIALILFLIIIIIFLGELLFERLYKYPKKIEYGVSFTPSFAEYLNLDWKKTYLKILDELKVANIRIPSYWSVKEKEQDKDDFSQLDFMVDEAEKRGVKLVLVLGVRQPRWPECHIPSWARQLTVSQRQEKILEFITKVVQRYKVSQAIQFWQVENEPLLSSFGKGCDPPDKKFLTSEADLVKSLDERPIIMTDSGELGFWITAMRLSDIFGTTLYRKVYDRILGHVTYPLPPYFYNLKSTIVRALLAKNNQKTIISELQAEPWSPKNDFTNMPLDLQLSLFSIKDFKEYISYAKGTGFDTSYLWGVEWWYWMAQKGHPEYLEYAKTLFE